MYISSEMLKPEQEDEDALDLYDGMIMEAYDDPDYIESLDELSLKKIKDRIEYYLDKYKSNRELFRHFDDNIGTGFLNDLYGKIIKKTLEGVLDMYDNIIIGNKGNYRALDSFGIKTLTTLEERLTEYHDILTKGNEDQKEELSERLGVYLSVQSIGEMLEYVETLLNEIEDGSN